MPPDPGDYPLGAALTTATLEHDPHAALAALRAIEPVSWVPALDGWLVTRYDLAVAVMRDAATFTVQDDRFSTAQLVGPSMLSLDGAAHARHRAPFAGPFRPAVVRERFTAAAQAECDALLNELAPHGRADLRAQFAGPLAARVLTRALGLDAGEAGQVRGAYEEIVAAVDAITAGRPAPEGGIAAHRALAERLLHAAETASEGSLLRAAAHDADARRGDARNAATHGAPAHDTNAHDANDLAAPAQLAPEELVANAIVLLFGGIDTTEGMIASALALALAHPGADPDRVIEESLRLEPAAAMVDRYATAATQLGGAHIDAGDLVHVSLTAANRDPAMFPEPDLAWLESPRARGHLAFAQGPHVCVGVHLARLETRIALHSALTRLPNLRPDPDHPAPRTRGLVFRKPDALNVVWNRTAPSP